VTPTSSPGTIVCKFGGSSVASAAQIRKVEAILRADPRRRFVVPSAPGKQHPGDQKITDLLYTCHQLASLGLSFEEPLERIKARYREIAAELGVRSALEEELAQVTQAIAGGASREHVASRGEYLSGYILAAYLGARFVDPAEGIRLTEAGRLDPASYERLRPHLAGDTPCVVPGFYGRGPHGEIRTFSRGGSDITGAVVARAVGAAVYENWTDVSGLLMADPAIVPEARTMREVTYRELRELAYMGAGVFHEEAMFPVWQSGISILIRNTNDPTHPGTRIAPVREAGETAIVGIAGRPHFSMIVLEKALMNEQRGFGRRLLEIFERHEISFEHAPTSIDSMGVIVRDEELGDKAEAVLRDVRLLLEPDRLELVRGLALIAIVGEGMAYRVGMAARLFGAVSAAGVNVRLINQGASEINIIIAVAERDFARTVRQIYHAFVA
jgi:aspartate kinase